MHVTIEKSWKEFLADEFSQTYFLELARYVRSEYLSQTVYPPPRLVFRAFNECPLDHLRVVIVGQDPYHTPGVADGLCFSSSANNAIPPSLHNIYKEVHAEYGTPIPPSPDLGRWAKQGVLLLNTTLTVRKSSPTSHQGKGWEQFTDTVIRKISAHKDHVVFMLWGAFAKRKEALIDEARHLILKSAHPSPLSAHQGFLGNNHFRLCNEYLLHQGRKPIVW